MKEHITVFDFGLTDEEMAAIDALNRGESGRRRTQSGLLEGI